MHNNFKFHEQQRQLQTRNAQRILSEILNPPVVETREGLTRSRDLCISGPLGTSKTTLILKCIYYLCMTNKIEVAIARNEKTTLYSSIVPTFRNLLQYGFRDVPENPIKVYGGERRPQEMHFKASESIIYFTGVDDSDKLFGNEYAIVFLNEVRRMDEKSYTDTAGRLRGGGFYTELDGGHWVYRLISDTNPDHPAHWLRKRMHDGQLKMIPTVLHDNPLYYYGGKETADGRDYRLYLEQTYTGFDYERFVNGEWVAAEGLVYPMFDPEKHVRKIQRSEIPSDWIWNATIDYGYSVTCYTLWAHPPGRRSEEAIAFKCIYHSGLTTDDIWEMIKGMHNHYQIDWRGMEVFADHEPDRSEFLRRQGLNVVNAEKRDHDMGVDAVKRHLWDNRLTFNEDLLGHYPDVRLQEIGECSGPLAEFSRYQYPEVKVGIPEKDDVPMKRWDHFMDNIKYYIRSYMDVEYSDYVPPAGTARPSSASQRWSAQM